VVQRSFGLADSKVAGLGASPGAATIPAVPGTDVEVRPVGHDDVAQLSVSLAKAFLEDPVSKYLFVDRRTNRLERYFRFQMRTSFLPRGEAWTTPDLKAASLWMPPKRRPPSLAEGMAQLPVVAILGRRTGRALRLVQMLESHHPHVPHYYLATIGTDPEVQGKGYGSALLAVVLSRCDAEVIPAYLESSKEENLPFYHRHGFEVVKEVLIPRTEVKLWLMWREPQVA
jgi:ribosomal protein S18 acetylase RimI-like enzyme